MWMCIEGEVSKESTCGHVAMSMNKCQMDARR